MSEAVSSVLFGISFSHASSHAMLGQRMLTYLALAAGVLVVISMTASRFVLYMMAE